MEVSATAHYTSAVWQQSGLSPPELSTLKGRALYWAMAGPSRAAALANGGHSLEKVLLRRHRAIDALVARARVQHSGLQVLELAAGLSGRGLRFTQEHPDLTYLETDLPGSLATKRRLLERLETVPSGHRTEPLDVLADPSAWRAALAPHLDLSAPVIVIAEGLLQYLTPDEMRRSWSSMFETFSGPLVYLANMTLRREGVGGGSVRALHALLGALVGRSMWTHFDTEEATVSGLLDAGFSEARLHAPGASPVQWVVEGFRAQMR
jgi:O-methyltransferase involved in polyketide biosynthesis